jgi:hypothetical protein
LAEAPPELLPKEPPAPSIKEPPRKVDGLDRYAEAALDRACRTILGARGGWQEKVLNGECFSIGTLAGSGAIPADFARDALQWAAAQITSYDPKRRWRAEDIEKKVDAAFNAGKRRPRGRRPHA